MPTTSQSVKQIIITLLKIAVAVGVLTYLVQSGKFDPSSLARINRIEIWLVGVVLFAIGFFINALRWLRLLKLEEVVLSFSKSCTYSIIGIFFNFVIPGGVGGDVVKAGYVISQTPKKKWFVGITTLLDRVFGMLALLLYASLMALFFSDRLGEELHQQVWLFGLAIFLGFVFLGAVLLFVPPTKVAQLFKGHPKLEKVSRPLLLLFTSRKTVVSSLCLSLVAQFFLILIFLLCGEFLGVNLPWFLYFFIVPLGIITTVVPIAPAGLGVGQASFYFLFEQLAQQGEFGVLVITFYQAVQFLVGCLGGLLFVFYRQGQKGNIRNG